MVKKKKKNQKYLQPPPEEKEKEEEEEILGETTEYDELIKTVFGGEIPKSKNTYKFF